MEKYNINERRMLDEILKKVAIIDYYETASAYTYLDPTRKSTWFGGENDYYNNEVYKATKKLYYDEDNEISRLYDSLTLDELKELYIKYA